MNLDNMNVKIPDYLTFEGMAQLAINKFPLIIVGLLTVVLGWLGIKLMLGLIKRSFQRFNVDQTVQSFVMTILSVTLKIVLVIALLSAFGVKLTILITILGAASLALGLALQGKIANIADGIALLVFKPFRVGDYIESGSIAGTVKNVGIFNTELSTLDNKYVLVPNSIIFDNAIINYSVNSTRRIDIAVGVAYDDDVRSAVQKAVETAKQLEFILEEPAPEAYVTDLGDSSVNMSVRAWCNRPDFLRAKSELIMSVKEAFDTSGFTIPFPQRDVHIYKEE